MERGSGYGDDAIPSARRSEVGEYLPDVYVEFTERYPRVADAQGELAHAVRDAIPFDERTTRLLKLALALGEQSDGAVRSNVRKALEIGVTSDELRAVDDSREQDDDEVG